MNRDDILKMARQACHPHEKAIFASPWGDEWVLKFAALIEQHLSHDGIHTCNEQCQRPFCVATREAVEREREACAKVCDEHWRFNGSASECADAIRARGER